jgi:hypothetical protein
MSLQRWSAISRGTIQKQIIRSRNLNRTNHPKHIRHNTNNWYDQKRPSTHGNSVLFRMPTCMQDLLVEIQRLQLHSISEPRLSRTVLSPRFHPRQWSTNFLSLESRLVCLQYDVAQRLRVVYPEIVVVRACQYVPGPIQSKLV